MRKEKKSKKLRGSRSMGWGKAKHRKAGSRGGRGFAGMKKHKWTLVTAKMPEYFGKKGFKRPKTVIKEVKTMNLEELEKLALTLGKQEIDLAEFGIEKVLGKGKLNKPLIVKAKAFSDKAKKKIEEIGGKCMIK